MTADFVDTREAQALRVADYLAQHPDATGADVAAACDVGSVTRVLSAMCRELGYGIRRGWRWVPCVGGTKRRHVRTYTLTHRPLAGRQLTLALD
jgi:hypothetical protein